jgi:hypothetical protein
VGNREKVHRKIENVERLSEPTAGEKPAFRIAPVNLSRLLRD